MTIATLLLLVNNKLLAQADNVGEAADSIEISLLTCSPHNEVYSLYGHTAIRFQDKRQGTDLAINYGVFSFQKPYFVIRFTFGLTDYEMGIVPFQDFCQEYQYYGSKVTQQTINLSNEEKTRIAIALQRNYEPWNRVYRYNYFYNNCTTKARDIIIDNISGKVVFKNKVDESTSLRDIIHSCNEGQPWTKFGIDLLLGAKADRRATRSDQEFLPANLMKDFATAVVISPDGKSHPLVKETTVVVEPDASKMSDTDKYPTPTLCAWILFAIVALTSATGLAKKKKLLFVDATLMLLCGLAGIVLFVMLFSEHPTTSTNLQVLLLNPVSLFFCYYIIRNRHKGNKLRRVWISYAVVLVLFLLCGFIQSYAEGIEILALSLLLRTICNLINEKGNDK